MIRIIRVNTWSCNRLGNFLIICFYSNETVCTYSKIRIIYNCKHHKRTAHLSSSVIWQKFGESIERIARRKGRIPVEIRSNSSNSWVGSIVLKLFQTFSPTFIVLGKKANTSNKAWRKYEGIDIFYFSSILKQASWSYQVLLLLVESFQLK